MLKYISANCGLLHTKLDDAIQLTHLIRDAVPSKNLFNYGAYIGLGGSCLPILAETMAHGSAWEGYNSFVRFNPDKHVGLVLLCSCDKTDKTGVDVTKIGFILLNFFPARDIQFYPIIYLRDHGNTKCSSNCDNIQFVDSNV
jgi:serine-type D-Ala-D-Ala carboxypeptidase/endopeptidase